MAVVNAFDRNKHFDELDSPLSTAEGVLTPTQRRERCLANLGGGSLTIAELGVLDGAVQGTATASKALVLDSDGDIDVLKTDFQRSASGNGTVPGGTVVAEEHGDAFDHVTKLTLTNFAVGTGGDAADLALGALCYTFPAGTIMVENASIKGIFDQASHGTITDGEVGLGTVVGSTAVDTLGEVGATSENILLGDLSATLMTNYVLGTTVMEVGGMGVGLHPFVILSAGDHTVYLNIAATWPNIASAEAVTFTGVVTLKWRKIS